MLVLCKYLNMEEVVYVDIGKKWDYKRSLMFLYLVFSHQTHFICLVDLVREMVPSSTVEAQKVRHTCHL